MRGRRGGTESIGCSLLSGVGAGDEDEDAIGVICVAVVDDDWQRAETGRSRGGRWRVVVSRSESLADDPPRDPP